MPNTHSTPKPWALLAYTVADDKSGGSSLDASVKKELQAIYDAADFARLSIAAQVDFKRTPGVFRAALTAKTRPRPFGTVAPDSYPLWHKIVESAAGSTIELQMERRDLNAARASVFQQFLRYGQERCPAERYVVFFYGHASGPMGLFYDADTTRSQPTTLRLTDLADSLGPRDPRSTILIFRDCFMNTLETAYELRNVGEFLIATQAEVPIAGVWPWVDLLAALLPSADSKDIARALAIHLTSFVEQPVNRGPFADVPYSAIDLREAHAIAPHLKALAEALQAARRDSRRRAACAEALEGARSGVPDDPTRPGDPALLDVPTMCDRLAALHDEVVSGPARTLGDAVPKRLIMWHHARSSAHRGISLYYRPLTRQARRRSAIEAASDRDAAADAKYYAQLALSEATGWHHLALDPL